MVNLIILLSASFAIGGALLGLLALGNAAGMAALWLAVGGLYLIYFALQRRGAGFYDPGSAFGGPALPAPGKRVLPAPRPRQITMSRRPGLPGPKK
jgi:hypothetical protein